MSSSRDFRDLDGADPWKLLGVSRSADADEIKRSYRRLSRSHHTDVGGDPTQQVKLNRAYEILTDPTRRADYALLLQHKEHPQDFVRPTQPEPDEPPADPFAWASGPGRTSTPPRRDPYKPPYEQPYQDPYTESPYADPPYRDSYRDTYAAPTHQAPSRGGVNGQAVAALLTVAFCAPLSIYLAFTALRTIQTTGQRGKAIAWLALLANAFFIVFAIIGGIRTATT